MSKPSKTILLVDDHKFTLELMSGALKRQGFSCLEAQSVAEALNILDKQTPDVILSDYLMPELDGFDFRRILLEDHRMKSIPFIFLTSYSDEELISKGYELEAVDYISKETPVPVIVSKLNNLISTVHRQHEQSISELRQAAEMLNLKTVPERIVAVPGFQIDFWHKSYKDYPGGDFIDCIHANEQYTFLVLGDVMGKKWGAWFFSFSFLSYIRAAIRFCVYDGEYSTSVIMQKINQVISLDPMLGQVLSTLALVRIDHNSNEVAYTGAGDLPLLHYRATTGQLRAIQSSGLLLGLFENGSYSEDQITLETGDQLLCFSDGMIDYEDEDGEKKSDFEYFTKSIQPLLARPDAFKAICERTVHTHTNRAQIDDSSLIFIKKTMPQ